MLIASLDFALHGSCKQLHRRVSFPVAARSHLNKMPCDFTPGNDPHCDIPVIPHSVRQANPPSRSTQSTSRGLLAQDTPQDPDIPSCPLAHPSAATAQENHSKRQITRTFSTKSANSRLRDCGRESCILIPKATTLITPNDVKFTTT